MPIEENTQVQWLDDDVREILLRLLAKHPEDRISAINALIHPWFWPYIFNQINIFNLNKCFISYFK